MGSGRVGSIQLAAVTRLSWWKDRHFLDLISGLSNSPFHVTQIELNTNIENERQEKSIEFEGIGFRILPGGGLFFISSKRCVVLHQHVH